jgi:DNA-binding MarR family transcriptional regulator
MTSILSVMLTVCNGYSPATLRDVSSPTGSDSRRPAPDDRPGGGVAFLLAQLGAHAASVFADRLLPLELRPAEVGVLSRLARSPGESQRALADALGMHAPRLVALIDDLEERGLVERRRDPRDRRNYAISLTKAGRQTLRQISAVVKQHEQAMTAALGDEERAQLASLLRRIADEQALTPGVHPGFRHITRSSRA